MQRFKYLYAPSVIALGLFLSGAATPTRPVRFAPATLGTTKYENVYSFVRFGVVAQGPELTPAERRALVQLVKTQDSLSLIANSGLEQGQQFSLSLPPVQQKAYKALAPKLLGRFVSCIKAMPEDSALVLLTSLAGVERPTDLSIKAKVAADFSDAVAKKCATPINDLPTKPYEERALSGVESLLTGELSIAMGGENYIFILSSLGDSIFGKPNAIFGEVAYEYLKTTITATITAMGKADALIRPDGFSTFVDFLVAAKTKTTLPTNVLESIADKCLAGVPDLFKQFNLSTCGSDTFTIRTIAIGDIEGNLLSPGTGI